MYVTILSGLIAVRNLSQRHHDIGYYYYYVLAIRIVYTVPYANKH